MSKKIYACPNANCSHRDRQQDDLEPSALHKAGVTDSWTSRAAKCSYCEMVYSIDTAGIKRIRGYFKGDLIEMGRWVPVL
jgi:hypothetical protein